jgi:hypothetical protein
MYPFQASLSALLEVCGISGGGISAGGISAGGIGSSFMGSDEDDSSASGLGSVGIPVG